MEAILRTFHTFSSLLNPFILQFQKSAWKWQSWVGSTDQKWIKRTSNWLLSSDLLDLAVVVVEVRYFWRKKNQSIHAVPPTSSNISNALFCRLKPWKAGSALALLSAQLRTYVVIQACDTCLTIILLYYLKPFLELEPARMTFHLYYITVRGIIQENVE